MQTIYNRRMQPQPSETEPLGYLSLGLCTLGVSGLRDLGFRVFSWELNKYRFEPRFNPG